MRKPCPSPNCSCQEPLWVDSSSSYKRPFRVYCPICGMMGPYAETEADAESLWNQLPRTHPVTATNCPTGFGKFADSIECAAKCKAKLDCKKATEDLPEGPHPHLRLVKTRQHLTIIK